MWCRIALSAGGALLALWLLVLFFLWRATPDQARVRDALRLLPDVLRLFSRLARDKDLPRSVRWRLWAALGYFALPIDLVPDVIPVLGYADDLVVAVLALRSVVRRAGPELLARHWPGTPEGLAALTSLARLS